MGLIIADISLIRIYDFVSKLFIPMQARLVLFSAISLACLASAFILLELIKPLRTSQERKNRLHLEIIYRITKLIQYALGAVIIYMILQMFLTSSYATCSLIILISCSYLLSISILGIFIARMLSLLSFNRNMIVLVLFVIAIGSVTANIVITLINVSLRLEERPSETRVQFGGSTDISKGKFNTLDNLYFYSYLISFITAWAATASLLRYYSHKFGKLKYWLITTLPIIFFFA